MPPPIVVNVPVLSRHDKDTLRQVIDAFRRAPKAAPGRTGTQPESAPQSSDVYISVAPASGIPAYTGTPVPIELDVYKITPEGTVAAGFTLPAVYNLGNAVSGNAIVILAKDKFGAWTILGSASGGTTPPLQCDSIPIHETDLRCESGLLNQYRRTITLVLGADGCWAKQVGGWIIDKALGCCDSTCTPTGTGTGPNEFAYYCLTPNPYVGVVCNGVDITRISQNLCMRVVSLGANPPGTIAGCAALFGEILRLTYAGNDGGTVGAGRLHTWQGSDSGANSCARYFRLTIQETLGGCAVTLYGTFVFSGGLEGIGSFGDLVPIPAVPNEWNPAVTYTSDGDNPLFSVVTRSGHPYISATDDPNVGNDPATSAAWVPLPLQQNADGYYTLSPDTLFQFATIHDSVSDAGLYIIFPCVGTEPFTGTGTALPAANSECFGPINHAQYLSLLDSGYVLSAGPFKTQADCLTACTPPDTPTGTGSGETMWYCLMAPDRISYGCLQLSIHDLIDLSNAGWVLLSGPYSGETECIAGCAPGTGTGTGQFDNCACGDLGAVVFACVRFLSGGSLVGCLSGVPLIHVGDGVYQGVGFDPDNGAGGTFTLRCENGNYIVKYVNTDTDYLMQLINCSPLDLLHVDDNISIRIGNDQLAPCCSSPTGTGTGSFAPTGRTFGTCTDVPASIVWEITTGDCIGGIPVTLNWSGGTYQGSASVCSGGATLTVLLYYDGAYHISLDCGSGAVVNDFFTVTCPPSPFALSGNFSGNLGAICGTFVFGSWTAG